MSDFYKDSGVKKTEIRQSVDLSKVEKIVNRITRKYEKEGIGDNLKSTQLRELRSLIADGTRAEIEIQKPSDLKMSFDPSVKRIGKIFTSLKGFFGLISGKLYNAIPGRKNLTYDLYSANINYSTAQYLAIASVVSFFSSLFLLIVFLGLFFVIDIALYYAVVIAVVGFLLISILYINNPKIIAKNRGKKIDKELPFALRHMATELRSGVGLYRVLQSIAVANYGIFSEEIARTISEVEEGADVKDALKNMSLRARSYSLRNAINHLLRSLKTGGNLSNVMNDIAEQVSFNIRIDIESFAEKMNFFGVIYIFIGIVTPVMIAILAGIRNAPLGGNLSFFSALPLSPLVVSVFFMVLLPLVMFGLVYYIKTIRPSY
jgi:archaeal flagellar protein FlaJ